MRRFADIFLWLVMAVAAAASCRYLLRTKPETVQTGAAKPVHVRLLFAGDLMQHLPQVNAARSGRGFDYSGCFSAVAPLFLEADLTIVNLETTLKPSEPYTGYPCFRSPDALAATLARLGTDAVVLANNHCCDGGQSGIRHTVEALEQERIAHTGAFADSADYRRNNILYLERNGIRFALVNYTYGTNGIPVPAGTVVHPLDTLHMASDLAAVDRKTTDCVIAFVHWGDEYARRPNGGQRDAARFLRRHGVDLIVGSHPHVVQSFEGDGRGFTLYSLGNFVSNQRKRYCDGGLLAGIDAVKNPDGRMEYALDLIPVWVQCPGYRILTSEAADTAALTVGDRVRYRQFVEDTEEAVFADFSCRSEL